MGLFEKLTAKARANRQRIVLPEGTEPRTLSAADRILADGLAEIILIGDPAEIKRMAVELSLKNIDKATIVNPADEKIIDRYAPLFFELRKSKGITMEEACRRPSCRCAQHHSQCAPRSISGYQDTQRH
jgi:phosphate acetyltransferase